MKKKISLPILFFIIFFISGCTDDDPVGPDPTGKVVISVKSIIDSSVINFANVVLFNANNGESVIRAFTNAEGLCSFENITPENYYVRISAAGFKELPPGKVNPVPFSVRGGETFSQTYYLDTLAGTFGKIEGKVNPVVSDVLIIADPQSGNSALHSYTGPDGYFVIYNCNFGVYKLRALKSGYLGSAEPEVTLSPEVPSANIQLEISLITGATLSGKVTFLAVNNGIVDVSILDNESFSVVNGLTTIIDTSRNYSIMNIPNGQYLAWASYKNDGYVMDPDWLFKNPGALNLVIYNDTAKSLNFSVTGAIQLISPTNPMNEVIPVLTDSIVPLFTWSAYPQAKEYIIEVRDVNGSLIWGGFDASGVIRHSQISKDLNSIRFNFDGSASANLVSGEIYQWRIFADDDAAPDVQTLLSGSEDLMGLFIVP